MGKFLMILITIVVMVLLNVARIKVQETQMQAIQDNQAQWWEDKNETLHKDLIERNWHTEIEEKE